MGRKQQNQRSGKIASSERTATLLASSAGTSRPFNGTGFLGTLPLKGFPDSAAENAFDNELRLLIKKLVKKDATTRVKALEELSQMIETKSADDFKGFLPHWSRIFVRIAIDIDRRVRETTFSVHKELCAKVGKQFATIMKSTLPFWLIGQHDNYGPCASAAKSGFMKIFPERKHIEVISFYLQDILETFQRNIVDTESCFLFDGPDASKEEKEVQLRDVQIATLQALKTVLGILSAADMVDPAKITLCKEYINEQFLWMACTQSSTMHRTCYYELLAICIQCKLIEVEMATKLISKFLKDQDPVASPAVWQATINLFNTHPARWAFTHSETRVFDHLKKAISRRDFGNSKLFFPLLLPLFAQIQTHTKNENEVFGWLQACFLRGLRDSPIFSDISPVCDAYFECLRYSLVHSTSNSKEVSKLQQDFFLPLLREVLLCDTAINSRIENKIFRESWSLIVYMEKQSIIDPKFGANVPVYLGLNEYVTEALKLKKVETLIVFYKCLSAARLVKPQAKRGVHFSGDKAEGKSSEIQLTDLIKDEQWMEGNIVFAMHTLKHCMDCPKSQSLELLELVLSLFNGNSLLETLEKSHNEDDLARIMAEWISDEASHTAAIRVCVSLASILERVPGKGLSFILNVQKKHPSLLLFIIHEVGTTTREVEPFISELFLSEDFAQEMKSALQSDDKFVIAEKCLLLRKSLPDSLIEEVLNILMKEIDSQSVQLKPFQESAHICRCLSHLFESTLNVWSTPLICSLVLALHDNFFIAYDTDENIDDCELRQEYLAALTSDHPDASPCFSKIITDLNNRLLHATKSKIVALTKYCKELIDAVEDKSVIKQLVPTSEQLEASWLQNDLTDFLASTVFLQSNGPVSFEDGPLVKIEDSENYSSCCIIMLKLCGEKELLDFVDIEYLILGSLVEPPPSVLGTLLPSIISKYSGNWEDVLARIASKNGFHWALVLEYSLKNSTARSSNLWENADYVQRQILHDFDLDLDRTQNLIDRFVRQSAAGEICVDSHVLALASRFLPKSNSEQTKNVRSILAALQGLKGKNAELFDTSIPSAFNLAVCSVLRTIVGKCFTCLETVNWDFILLVVSTMVKNYPWKGVNSDSRMSLTVGVYLCDILVAIDDLSQTGLLPDTVDHEWKEFYMCLVARTLIPLLTADVAILKSLPSVILEHLARFFTLLNAQEVKKVWLEADNDCDCAVDILGKLCVLIFTKVPSVQLAAYALTVRIMDDVADEYIGELAEEDFGQRTKVVDPLYFILQDFANLIRLLRKTHKGATLNVRDLSKDDKAVFVGYVLTMTLVMKFGNKINPELRSGYIELVEEEGYWSVYLDSLFELVHKESPKETLSISALPPIPLDPLSVAFWAILEMANNGSDVLKSWYTKLNNYKVESRVSNIMTKFISPIIIERELNAVKVDFLEDENLTLLAMNSTREIIARYALEDTSRPCEITIQMEPCHPLKPMKISYDPENIAISKTKWQNWMRQLNAFLHANNAEVIEGIKRWKSNLDSKLQGADECVICYSVLHASTLRLPTLPCRTCKNKYHTACMYKWFQEGHNSCPLCRSIIG